MGWIRIITEIYATNCLSQYAEYIVNISTLFCYRIRVAPSSQTYPIETGSPEAEQHQVA